MVCNIVPNSLSSLRGPLGFTFCRDKVNAGGPASGVSFAT
jgi:hypothetical protein